MLYGCGNDYARDRCVCECVSSDINENVVERNSGELGVVERVCTDGIGSCALGKLYVGES